MIDSIITSTERNSDIVGLALNPKDAYELEKEGKEQSILVLKMCIQLATMCLM